MPAPVPEGIQQHKPPDPLFLLGTHTPLSSASPHAPAQALSSQSNCSRVANTPCLQVSVSLSKSLCSPHRAAFLCISQQEAEAQHNSSHLGCSRQDSTSLPPRAVKDQAKFTQHLKNVAPFLRAVGKGAEATLPL